MPSALLQAAGRPLLGAGERDRMRTRAAECVRRARRSDECPVAITTALAPGADPTAIAVASRRPGEDWFCFENPDRDRFALATLGRAAALDDRDEGRFERVAARWRALVADPACDEGGPVASAASPSRPDGGTAPHWAGFEPASLQIPESLCDSGTTATSTRRPPSRLAGVPVVHGETLAAAWWVLGRASVTHGLARPPDRTSGQP
jgi:hypothetical protein